MKAEPGGPRAQESGAWLVSNLPLSRDITRITLAVLFIGVLTAANFWIIRTGGPRRHLQVDRSVGRWRGWRTRGGFRPSSLMQIKKCSNLVRRNIVRRTNDPDADERRFSGFHQAKNAFRRLPVILACRLFTLC